MELLTGDCIDSILPEGVSIETVELVLCSGPWQYKVLSSLEVDDLSRYPGEAYFREQADESCDRRYSTFLFPFQELWDAGYRTVTCLQESFGLSVVDPAKLDRLVGSDTLRTGECVNDAPETEFIMAELVDCSGPWQYRVLESFEVDAQARYPGELFFFQQALERCDRRYNYLLYPTEESWGLGDRLVNCTQESFDCRLSTLPSSTVWWAAMR